MMRGMKRITVNWHLEKDCNYKCKFCYAHFSHINTNLNIDQGFALIDEIKKNDIYKINFAGGEPLLNKNVGEFIKYSNQQGLKTSIITIIFSNHKLYWEGSIADFKKSTMEVFEQKLQNIVATAPPEQKEIAKELIQQIKDDNNANKDSLQLKAKINIKYSGIQENIAGFNSKKYEIYSADSLVEYIWVTDSLKPYKDIDLESMISFTNQLKPSNVMLLLKAPTNIST